MKELEKERKIMHNIYFVITKDILIGYVKVIKIKRLQLIFDLLLIKNLLGFWGQTP